VCRFERILAVDVCCGVAECWRCAVTVVCVVRNVMNIDEHIYVVCCMLHMHNFCLLNMNFVLWFDDCHPCMDSA